ncbi:MAG: A/G-specific adenine glycosylase, partial [Clostridia bacterium]|nr:A/G-specific adenine glycosylase [Clostridia bacterium]
MEKISDTLINWYEQNKRDLPWRRHKDAYAIWVSEIMLQQTRVEAAIPYYERFLAALPNIVALANAPEEQLLKLWEGLGYYSRVRNMQKAAKICMELHNGCLPEEPEELQKLPGIGRYTAGAIASMAYGKQVCSVDGNLCRVYARLYNLEDDMMTDAAKRKVENIIQQDMAEDMGSMNQALMDIGAGICLPGEKAKCGLCPLQNRCEAYKTGRVAELPLRKKAAARRVEEKTVVICRRNGQVLLHRRPDSGLLAGLIEFPLFEGHLPPEHFPNSAPLKKHKHVFSHLEWHLIGY